MGGIAFFYTEPVAVLSKEGQRPPIWNINVFGYTRQLNACGAPYDLLFPFDIQILVREPATGV